MNSLLVKFVCMSLSGSVIAAILLFMKRFTKYRFSQTWHYYIWLAVILRLLIPYSPEINFMAGLYNLFEGQFQIKNISMSFLPGDLIDIFTKYMGIVWFCIFAMLMIKKIISYQIYTRFMRNNREKITDAGVLNVYGEVREYLHMGQNIGLYSYTNIDSPMLIGCLNPYILLPESMLNSPDKLKYILLHEITHYKKKDFLYKWLLQIVSCLYFFNPAMVLLQKEISKLCELSCDEAVIRHMDDGGKKAYGSALLYALAANSDGRRLAAVSLMMCEDVRQIKERLNAIKRYKANSFLTGTASVMLTAVISFCAVFVGIFEVYINNGNCNCIISQLLTAVLR